jgi:gamma-glutamyltranspeptidase/glutathione hydrolase
LGLKILTHKDAKMPPTNGSPWKLLLQDRWMRTTISQFFIALLIVLASEGLSSAKDAVVPADVAIGRHGMVVAVSPEAARAGVEVLKKGGNAVDAAVATAFALAVTYPQAGNIGGGGFMMVFSGNGKTPEVIDYRETAPAAARANMYAKEDSKLGYKVIGVPGTVRGLALAHERHGKLPWQTLLTPAIELAEKGFAIDDTLANSLNGVLASSDDFPELRRVFTPPTAAGWNGGDRLVQKDLAGTLRLIAEHGPDAFYKGAIAKQIAAEMKAGRGLITAKDLEGYQARARPAIHGIYRGYDIYGPPPPSSGGICLVEILNILENFDLAHDGRWAPVTMHRMVEAMRRGFCDRARYLGDPDFTKIPAKLTSKPYAHELALGINPNLATPSQTLAPDIALAPEGDNTTHFSVVDSDGMAVSNTYTLEHSYGSRVVVRGAGFLLNDEMIDFNWQPGVTDRLGGIGTAPNQIAPGKRMLSSQTPTLVVKDGKVLLVTGSPGSRTIINTVVSIVVNVIDFHMDIREAVDAPRLHHPWFPDIARFEGMSNHSEAVFALRRMGHKVQGIRQGDAHSIWIDPGTGVLYGAADHRIHGLAIGY